METSAEPGKRLHVSAFEPATFVVSVAMAALSGAICMQIISKLGITPNTSIIGAVVAMAVARIPLRSFRAFRSLDRQNLVQTMTSAGGFGAANCVLLSVGILYLLGYRNLAVPMAIGSAIGMLVDMLLVWRTYDTPLFPASGPWPPGVATAEAIFAGDEGGKRARRLLEGIVAGVVGSYFKLPMAGIGIVFIANIFAMSALGIGLIFRGYSQQLFSIDLGKTYIPHGIMIGAGIVSLIQAANIIIKGYSRKATSTAGAGALDEGVTVSARAIPKAFAESGVLFVAGSLVLAVVSGVFASMSAGQIFVWVAWASFSALVSTVLVGMCAMHSGWFPGFAITVIFLTLGVFMNIPAVPLALLTGYVTSTGPCLADLGYDLKTGWLLRGRGKNPAYELEGRKQQFYSELVGAIVAMAVVLLFMDMHFKLDLLPPVSRVFATTIKAGADPKIISQLVMWAIPGAILQAIGGSSKALGILFATGLLIKNPIYGIGVLMAVVVRLIIGTEPMEVREAGLIAGDGIYGFASALLKTFTG
ncbi:MAG: peptide transporter [Firmicutes bacterium]|nr:peptide transporter [Bacillota bacterium]